MLSAGSPVSGATVAVNDFHVSAQQRGLVLLFRRTPSRGRPARRSRPGRRHDHGDRDYGGRRGRCGRG